MKKLKLNLDELRNQLESIDNDDAKTLLGGKTIHLSHNPNDDFWLPKDNEFQNFEVTDTTDYYDSGEDFDVEFDQSFGTTNYGGYGQDFPSMTFSELWYNYPTATNNTVDNIPYQCAVRLGKTIQTAYGYSFDNSEYTTNWGPVTSDGYPTGANSLADFLHNKTGAPQVFTSKASFEASQAYGQTGIIFFKDLKNASQSGLDHIDVYAGYGTTRTGYYDADEIWFYPLN